MHKLVYLGTGRYQCTKCQEFTDKYHVQIFLSAPCSADVEKEELARRVSALMLQVSELTARVGGIEERMLGYPPIEGGGTI